MAGPSGIWELYDRTGVTRVDRRIAQGGSVETIAPSVDVTTIGTMVSAFEIAGDGRDLPGIAVLVASAVDVASPTHTCTITITFAGGKHPQQGNVITGVVCDGTTANEEIWPGYLITPTASGSLANGWTTVLYGGLWSRSILRAGNPNGTQWNEQTGLFTPGQISVSPGDPGAIWTVVVKNASAEAQDGCTIKRYPTELLYDKVLPRIFRYIQTVSDAPIEDVYVGGKLRPYKLRAQGRSGGLGHVELSSHPWSSWAEFNVRNVSSGVDGTSHNLAFDNATTYVITDGPAEGTVFVLSPDATNSSIENLTVTADDKYFLMGYGATPSAWSATELATSETGRSDQVYLASGTSLLTLKLEVDSLASEDQNPFAIRLYMESSRVGTAGYAD